MIQRMFKRRYDASGRKTIKGTMCKNISFETNFFDYHIFSEWQNVCILYENCTIFFCDFMGIELGKKNCLQGKLTLLFLELVNEKWFPFKIYNKT